LIVVLIGPMGAGKSTIGKPLASRLRLPFIDLDEAIVKRAGKPIPQIFEEDGESAFRSLESEMVAALLNGPEPKIIATGGGAVLRESNRQWMKAAGPVIWLDALPEVLAKRTANDPNRPLLKGDDPLQKARELDMQRRPLYEACSDFRVDTASMSVEEAVEAIGHFLSEYGDE